MKPILFALVLLCALTSSLYAQTPRYLIANGEYQNFILDNSTQTLYGLGTGGNGIGSNTGPLGTVIPCQFPSANTKIKFAAGGLHTGTAIDVAGNLYFTGANEDGTMGNGTTGGGASSFVPVTTDNLGNPFNNITSVVMGSSIFTGGAGYGAIIFAIKSDGTLWVWGNTQGGYAGDGTAGRVITRPTQVPLPAGTVITKVVVQDIVIALDSKGNVWTWAGNGPNNCLLGSLTRTNYMTPQILTLPAPAKDIAGGGLWSYALLNNGSLYGWGLYLGYMGVGPSAGSGWTNLAAPMLLDGQLNLPSQIAHISCNATTTYAILNDGTLWAWGGNECGQVGNGIELNYAKYTLNPAPYGGSTLAPYAWNWDMSTAQCQQHKPVNIAPGLNNFVSLSEGTAAVFYKFAVDANGQLYAWGRNKYGVLGNGVMDANPVNGNIGSIYPNSWDVPYVTAFDPFSIHATIQSTSPYCIGNPTSSPCNVYSIPANTPPVSMINGTRGGSQTVSGVSSVTLDGTGSTDNVAIVYYVWSQVSGPNTPIISIPSGKKVNILNMISGTYVFQLKTIDNGWMKDSTTYTVTVNASGPQPPVANAGPAQTITLPVNSVTLTGSGSEVGGTIASYGWSQVSGPATAAITAAGQAQTTVTGLMQGTYVFQLKVTDNNGKTATSTVTITVKPAIIVPGPPSASAGTNQTITLPVSNATLTGSGTEINGVIVSYAWTQLSGPSTATFTVPNQAITAVTGLMQGVYNFQLLVTDNSGKTATATVQVTVNPPVVVTGPPVANAGTAQTITLPVNSVTLTGSGSETNGTIVSYAWSQISGPGTASIASPGQASTAITGLVQGVYNFQLKVTDNSGKTATATVQVTVNPPVVVTGPPVANAGPAQTITLPVNSVTLTGSGSETNGTIVSYAWSQISGPGTASIASPGQASTAITGLVQGVYNFQLKVTDNSGKTATATVQVTVNPPVVVTGPPVANAGFDQTITLPASSTSLIGSGSETNGKIVSYSWSQVSGPSQATFIPANQATCTVSGLVKGSYVFQLKVTDAKNISATDLVVVNVASAAASNLPPVANAGPDQTLVMPVTVVKLDGSASYDTDGQIVKYQWIQVSGSGGVTITGATSSVASAYGLVAGVYTFKLTVTDNNGASGTATVTITVNKAVSDLPVANAGNDTIIAFPTSSVLLNGDKSYASAGNSILSYSWTQLSGPSNTVFSSTSGVAVVATQLTYGKYVFQLTVTDDNNQTATSTVTVQVISPSKVELALNIYPNPIISNQVNITGTSDGQGSLIVILNDINGKQILKAVYPNPTGVFQQTIPLPSLANGVYLLSIQMGNTGKVFKVVKQ